MGLQDIMSFFTGGNQQQKDADLYYKYWDKVKQMDAAGIPIPNTRSPSMGSVNALLGITPSPKSGLGKIADMVFNKGDNKFRSPVPYAKAEETNNVPEGSHMMPDGSMMKNNEMNPTQTPSPTPTPIPQRIDFTDYTAKTLPKGLPQVPKNLTDLFFQEFGSQNEATPAAAVTVGENAGFNTEAVGQNYDKAGNPTTRDLGLMQINSGTFDGLKKRRPKEMEAIGIKTDTPYEVLFDPVINMKVAKLVRKDEDSAGQQPFDQWYGWKNPPLGKGINLREMMKKLKKK